MLIQLGESGTRPVADMRRAKKILQAIRAGDLPNPFPLHLERERFSLQVAEQVLDWVLNEEGPRGFQRLLEGLEIRLSQAGCHLDRFNTPE